MISFGLCGFKVAQRSGLSRPRIMHGSRNSPEFSELLLLLSLMRIKVQESSFFAATVSNRVMKRNCCCLNKSTGRQVALRHKLSVQAISCVELDSGSSIEENN